MTIVKLKVDLVGTEILINGFNVLSSNGKHMLEEKIFAKQLTLEQQHMVICEARQLLAKMVDAHRKRQLAAGELTEDKLRDYKKSRITSGAGGIPGTDVGPLIVPR
jgi:hypothetical protein